MPRGLVRSDIEDVDDQATFYVLPHRDFMAAAGPMPRSAIRRGIRVDPNFVGCTKPEANDEIGFVRIVDEAVTLRRQQILCCLFDPTLDQRAHRRGRIDERVRRNPREALVLVEIDGRVEIVVRRDGRACPRSPPRRSAKSFGSTSSLLSYVRTEPHCRIKARTAGTASRAQRVGQARADAKRVRDDGEHRIEAAICDVQRSSAT